MDRIKTQGHETTSGFLTAKWIGIWIVLGLALSSCSAGALPVSLRPKPTQADMNPPALVRGPAGDGAAIPTQAELNLYVRLAKQVVPAVVNISTVTLAKGWQGSPEEMFRRFYGDFFGPGSNMFGAPRGRAPGIQPQSAPRSAALGTGFVIDESGLILTNNHVVQGPYDSIQISFTEDPAEKPVEAKVVGRDPDIDVALIRVKTSRKLAPLRFGDSDALEVGEWVAAVGNPFGQGHSLTHGVISAKGRTAPDFPLASYIQTDAPINPGNSGGPLVNTRGEVIGINSAIDARAQGIGFAVPINLVKKVLGQLESNGRVARGYLGVMVGSLTPDLASQVGMPKDAEAAVVSHVYPGSPAARAGLEPYDVILEAGGKPVRSANELTTQVAGLDVGAALPLKIQREGHVKSLTIKLGQRPS